MSAYAEIIVDSFAGGGGASTGIELALGRSPDVAINHDANAIALHRANHPETVHLTTDIWGVDPATVAAGRMIGLLWASPTCTHFSKAKGGALVDRNIRDLAWVVCRWAELPRATKPRVIILENVEEFRGWGPVGEDGKPVKEFSGVTYEAWVGRLKTAGYKVQWRELRACDYGAPTIRKRLFVIARSDGKPIVWPKPTHAPAAEGGAAFSRWAKEHGLTLRAARRLPNYRTAAEIIDWSLPCPSIFDTAEEIWRKHGLRAKRPLADATLRRIARGITRYVLDSPRPFIVPTTHPRDVRTHDSLDPLPTITNGGSGRGEHALVMPIISYAQQGGGNRPVDAPMHTLCASPKDQNTLVAATMLQTGYGERPGQKPRSLDIEAPIGTQVAGGSKHAVVAAFLAQHNAGPRNGGISGREVDAPISTVTAAGAQQQVVAASLLKFNSNSTGSDLDQPAPTITANSYVKRPGGAAPIGLMAASLMVNTTGHAGAGADDPLPTVTTGNHASLVAAFLCKYYGAGEPSQAADEPLHTITTKPRHGLVTVEIDGATYAIVDIVMRMLTPRERFLAQGFPADYEIEQGVGPAGEPVRLTLDAQGRACGNSVCPPLAAALVAANCADMAVLPETEVA